MNSPEDPSKFFETEAKNFLGKGSLYTTGAAMVAMRTHDKDLHGRVKEKLGQDTDLDSNAGAVFAFNAGLRYPFSGEKFHSELRKFIGDCENGKHNLYIFASERPRRTAMFAKGVSAFLDAVCEQISNSSFSVQSIG